MTTEHDALWRYQRDLEAERRHTNPERMRRDLARGPASPEALREIVAIVAPPTGRKPRLQVVPGRRSA